MTSQQIRQQFIDFFVQKHGHTAVPSSPVVPHDDPTLLFTNAGMNQFKPIFLGQEKRAYTRAVDTQKCIRAGGKHNDLDDVGRSRRHHTFFEMLGNWSFGDYFKRGAIEMSWELLTKVWNLDPQRIHVSCYEGNEKAGIPRDTEAANLWKEIAGLPDDHIHYFGKDNFWEMGDTGPCGPCTEIYYDRTPDKTGGPQVNGDDPRVMEIWNNVFIQYNRDANGALTTLPAQHVDTGMGFERICQVLQGKEDNYGTDLWTPLFDRISEISGLKYTGSFPKSNTADPQAEAADPQLRHDIAFRVVADHARCLTFALTDGAVPSNEGRGYVLRRILRRGVFWGRKHLGLQQPFLHCLVPVVVEAMGGAFPELHEHVRDVMRIIEEEEVSFGRTWNRGMEIFESSIDENLSPTLTAIQKNRAYFEEAISSAIQTNSVPATDLALLRANTEGVRRINKIVAKERLEFSQFADRVSALIEAWQNETAPTNQPPSTNVSNASTNPLLDTSGKLGTGKPLSVQAFSQIADLLNRSNTIDAETAFKLHDTYGFPIDLTRIMAAERGMTIDDLGFDRLMEEARLRSRKQEGDFDLTGELTTLLQYNPQPLTNFVGYAALSASAKVLKVFNFLKATDPSKRDQCVVVDTTPFYAESGGQVSDTGLLDAGGERIFRVSNIRRIGSVFVHVVDADAGKIFEGTEVHLQVEQSTRRSTEKNHTTTHLANWALREVLGDGVQQKGSLVDPEKLRFDFSHNKSLADDELAKVEQLVIGGIANRLPVYAEEAPQELALKINGLRAVFGEKYPPMVRVVSIGAPVKDLLADPANAKWRQFSVEFCGGTHLKQSGEAECFTITAEESVSKGIRRIVALTGPAAFAATDAGCKIDDAVAKAKAAPDTELATLIAGLQKSTAGVIPLRAKRRAQAAVVELQSRQKKFEKAKAQSTGGASGDVLATASKLLDEATPLGAGKLVVGEIPNATAEQLMAAVDSLKKKAGSIAVFLAAAVDGKVSLITAVSDDLIAKGLKAGDWIREPAKLTGGGGGGRPQMAQAGGKDASKLPEALSKAREFATATVK